MQRTEEHYSGHRGSHVMDGDVLMSTTVLLHTQLSFRVVGDQ